MKNVIYCKKCLYTSSHPFGITFDEKGICSGCQVHEEKNSLDWDNRLDELKNLTNKYKSKTKKNYDCIVPISGGSDSYFIVHIVKNILRLNPLLVCNNKYFNTEIGIKNLTNLRIKFDADILIQNLNINTVKKITKFTLSEFGNIYWPIIAGQTVYPVQMAIKYEIPLIIWGANQGLEQVGMYSHLHNVEMSRRYREDHDLFGNDAIEMKNIKSNLSENDIFNYLYPDDKLINKIGVRGIYLGNYIKWDPTKQHNLMVKKFNYRTMKFKRTFDVFDHVDCFNYMNVHDILKLYKHGYSKVTDHACREIRHGRLTKNNAIDLVKYYEKQKIIPPKHLADWLEIDLKSLNFIFNQFKNKKFWKQKNIDNWKFNGLNDGQKKNNEPKYKKTIFSYFKSKNKHSDIPSSKYIIFGKGT
jgi:N-acetyl sugar amidotransferase